MSVASMLACDSEQDLVCVERLLFNFVGRFPVEVITTSYLLIYKIEKDV